MAVIPPNTHGSIHAGILFRRTFIDVLFGSVQSIAAGSRLLMNPSLLSNFAVGQRVYIGSGTYAGNYTVLNIDTYGIDIAVTYQGSEPGYVKPLNSETVKIYAGYESTHPAHTVYPYQLIAEFTALPGLNGETVIDVGEYLKGVMKIDTPNHGRDYSMILPYKVEMSGYTPSTLYAYNSTIPEALLNTTIGTAYHTMQRNEPIHFSDNTVMYSIVTKDGAVGYYMLNVFGINGTGNPGGLGFDAVGSTFTIA